MRSLRAEYQIIEIQAGFLSRQGWVVLRAGTARIRGVVVITHTRYFRTIAGLLLLTLAAVVFLTISGKAAGNEFRLDEAIVVTQFPPDAGREGRSPNSGGMLRVDYGEGARIVLVEPGREARNLTRGFHSACEPDISFDGKRMLFAGKREAADPWNVYEMALDGSEVLQITDDAGDSRNPVYQGQMYVITSDRPWDQITFVSTRAGEVNEYGSQPSTSLYSCLMDGSSVRRLTFNPSSDLDPTVLPDGRLLFSSWQRSTLGHGPRGRVSLFAVLTDGLDYSLFVGDEGRRIKHMPCVADELVVFVEGDRVGWDGAGSLASVSMRRNLHSYRSITGPGDGLFVTPSRLAGDGILASRRPPGGEGTHGVVHLDVRTGRFETVFDDPDLHDVEARAVVARPRPDGRSSPVSDDRPNGVLYGLNVYDSDLAGRGWIAPGQAVRMRVLEGIPRTGPAGATSETTTEAPPMLPRRFLGEVAVEEDGSFNVEVPANIPIELQLIDEQGMALRSCSWIWVRNRETRGCIGCHEDGERTPENRFVKALEGPSVALTLPPGKRRTVEFGRDVRPIVSAKCSTSNCHTSGVSDEGIRNSVHPGSARTSPLIWHIFGRNTSRPWDAAPVEGVVPKMPPPVTAHLTDDERATLVEWIDLGASLDAVVGPDTDSSPEGGSR